MSEGKHLVLVVVGVLLLGLSQVEETHGQSMEPELCQPAEYAFANNSVIFTDSSCIQYDSNTQAPNGINPSEYFRCTFPSILTNSDLGSEKLPPDDNTTVYTWEPGVNQVLFTYNGSLKSFSSIVVYYYHNSSGVGLPKISFCPMSEDSEIWNATSNSENCEAQDDVRPGNALVCNSPPCRENVTIEVTFNANKVLLLIEDSKNYNFIASEMQFFAATLPESTTTIQATDGSTGTSTTTEDTGMATSSTTVINTQPMTTRDGGVGVKQIKETLFACVSIAVISVVLFL